MEPSPDKKCALCGAILDGVAPSDSGDYRCGHCGTTGRYEGESLAAIFIPNYHARLVELEKQNKEILQEIELEGVKGEYRDMRYLQKKHLERQDVLAEYSFLSYFGPFVEKW